MSSVFDKYTSAQTLSKIVDYPTVADMWAHSVKTYPNNIAIVDRGEYTYLALDEEVAKFRTVLKNHGVKLGDRVGIYIPNGIDFVKAFLAITTLGAVAVLMPPHLDEVTVFGCSFKFSLSALVYDNTLSAKLGMLKEKNPAVVTVASDETAEDKTDAVCVDTNSPCAILFTGGTTGKSKGALLSHRAVMRGAKNGCYGVWDVFEQRIFLVLPLTHVFGLIRNMLTSLYTGSTLYICRNNKDMFREIAVFKPTVLVLVPALAEMALNLSKQFGKNLLGNDIKYIICGASTVAPYLVTEYHNIGVTLLPGYGLTESANLVSGNPEALKKPDSVGFIYPGMDYKIVDGELCLKGVNMMDGYIGEDESAIVYDEEGYFKTGDLVRIDEEGFLYITGRKKEIIVLSSGENVSPAEVEAKFYAIDGIQDCLVYELGGVLALEILPRVAVLKEKGIQDVEAYIKEQVQTVNPTLPPFAQISKIIIRDKDFVRSPSMKILRGQQNNDKN